MTGTILEASAVRDATGNTVAAAPDADVARVPEVRKSPNPGRWTIA
jgi:hypothetical protein